jgi:hypothetical protein
VALAVVGGILVVYSWKNLAVAVGILVVYSRMKQHQKQQQPTKKTAEKEVIVSVKFG